MSFTGQVRQAVKIYAKAQVRSNAFGGDLRKRFQNGSATSNDCWITLGSTSKKRRDRNRWALKDARNPGPRPATMAVPQGL
jgi:hypothetical protein